MGMSTLVFFMSANETAIKPSQTTQQKFKQQEKMQNEILKSETRLLQQKSIVPEKKKIKKKSYPRGNIATH